MSATAPQYVFDLFFNEEDTDETFVIKINALDSMGVPVNWALQPLPPMENEEAWTEINNIVGEFHEVVSFLRVIFDSMKADREEFSA